MNSSQGPQSPKQDIFLLILRKVLHNEENWSTGRVIYLQARSDLFEGVAERAKGGLREQCTSIGAAGMRIIHVVDSMEIGGAETIVAQLCRAHREHGHDPSVCCLVRLGPLGAQLHREGFRVDVVGGKRTLETMWKLRRYFHLHRPDAVHTHNLFATVVSAIPAKTSGAVVVATRHGLCEPPFAWWPEIRYSIAARWCDWVVAVCDAAAENLATAPFAAKSRIIRVYNGTAPDGGTDILKPEHSFTLVTVGRLAPAKDQQTLLIAFAIAAERVSDLHLLIVGCGALEVQLRRHAAELGISEKVTFCGEQQNVTPYLRAANVFALSSISEGLPISLLEAMSHALPVIVTDVGGMREVVQRCGAGVVVPRSDPNSFAAAIIDYAQRRASLAEIGWSARQCYLEHFTLDRMAADYLSLYAGAGPPR